MMTETKARVLDLTEPRLAPLRREDLPSFVVDVSTFAVLGVTAACARLGVAVGHHLPPKIEEAARATAEGRGRPAALVKLRLPRSLTPLLFRAILLDVADAPAVLFADPAAVADDAALAVETRPATPAPSTPMGLEPREGTTRFTFETDRENRLSGLSASLATALGPQAEAWIGASFPELERDGLIVSGHAIAEALERGASFSGVHVTVPGSIVLDLELGGVPLLDVSRHRVATRGFGVLRRWTTTAETPPAAFDLAPDADVRMPLATRIPPAGERPWSNVVPFNGLTPRESNYFDEIGRTLEAAMRGEPARGLPPAVAPQPEAATARQAYEILDTLPLATLLEDNDELVHANRTFFQWTGWPDLAAVRDAGGLASVLRKGADASESQLLTASGEQLAVAASEADASFFGPDAHLHLLQLQEAEQTPPEPDEDTTESRRAALDLVPWPVLLLNTEHLILFANHAAEARLGYAVSELVGQPITLIITPEARGEAIGWLDRAAQSADRRRPRVLHLHPLDGEDFRALGGLAPVGDENDQICLVLGPEPREDPAEINAAAAAHLAAQLPSHLAAPAQAAGALPAEKPVAEPAPPESGYAEDADTAAPVAPPPSAAAAAPLPPVAPQLEPSLHLVARRLVESLNPSFSTLRDYAPTGDAPAGNAPLPDGIRDALERVRSCLDDLGALAAPAAEPAPETTEVTPIVTAAVTLALPAARRRRITVRTDIDDVPPVLTQPARLARLVRLMIEDALDGTPVGSAMVVSLLCDDGDDDAPVVLQVADAGPSMDEVADAAARMPLAPSTGEDRFSRAGRPLRRARLASEAQALGATFELRRGLEIGMTTLLSLPR